MAILLLDYGTDIDYLADPNEGLTLLMQFCEMGVELSSSQADINLEVVEFLLEHGADRNKKNKNNETAWDMASSNPRKDEIRKLLEETKQVYSHKDIIKPLPSDHSVIIKEIENQSNMKNATNCDCLVLQLSLYYIFNS